MNEREQPALRSVEHFIARSVIASSRGRSWPGIEVMTARMPSGALDVTGLETHTLAINAGAAFALAGRVGRRRFPRPMATGAMMLVEAGPASSWRWEPGQAIEMLHVSLDAGALRGYAAEIGVPDPQIRTDVGFRDRELERIGAAFEAELHGPVPRGSLVTDALRIAFVTHIVQRHSSLAGHPALHRPAASLGHRMLRRIDEYVETHLGFDIGIADLAALAGLSRFHFSRLFRATVGVTPYQYVLRRRLDRARGLLLRGGTGLSDVALLSGFADQSHLTRAFRRRFGVTPGTLYRR